jgi:transcriptional regulator with XRE-family HTH domain
LALAAGIERNFVSLIERGINQPTIRVIFKLAAPLNIGPSEMVKAVEQNLAEAQIRSTKSSI